MSSANDSIVAKVATLGALDVVDAGAGTDTLTIEESVAIPSLGGATFKGVETVNISTTTGDIGAIYKAGTAAGTTTAAVAQVLSFDIGGTIGNSEKYNVRIGDVVYETAATASTGTVAASAVHTLVKTVLDKYLADTATTSALSTATFKVTSGIAGTPLPTISISAQTGGAATFEASATGNVANVVGTGPGAVKQVLSIVSADAGVGSTTADDLAAGDVIKVAVNGTTYSGISSGTTAATAATDIAAILNTALGAPTATPYAVASGGTVLLSAPTAGTPLPLINVEFTDAVDWSSTVAVVTANQAANAAAGDAVAAASISAPTGATSLTATAAAGNANVDGGKTTDLTVTGKVVQTSGGADVTVSASDSVFVSGATGAVSIKAGATTTSIKGAVTSNSGGAATDAAGIYVTGGTTVDITGSKTTTGAIKVGAAGYAKAAANATGGLPQSNGNLTKTPTGDVTITTLKVDTSTSTGLKNLVYGSGARDVYTNGAESVTVKGGTAVTVTDVQTTALQSAVGVAAAPGTSTLAKVTLAGLGGNATITSDALTDIFLSDTLSARTVTVSNSGAEGVNKSIALHTSNTGTSSNPNVLNHSTAESVVLGSTAANAYTSVGGTANNTGSASYITLTTPKATEITAVNTLGVNLGNFIATAPKVAVIDASQATGSVNVTIGATPLQGLNYVGGAGKDTVVLAGSLAANATSGAVTAISLGAGDDTLANSNVTAKTMTGVTIDAGDGNDTVFASLVNAGNSEQFVNFERLGLDFITTKTYDVSLKSGIDSLVAAATIGAATVTYTGVAASQDLIYAKAQNASAVLTLTMGTAELLGTADSYTVTAAGGVGTIDVTASNTVFQLGTLNIDSIEHVNIVSTGAYGYVDNTLSLGAEVLKTITIVGNQDLSLSTAASGGNSSTTPSVVNGLGVSSIDATGLTGDLDLATANFVKNVYGLTVSSGSGNDLITLAGGLETVLAGDGNDKIVTAASSSTLSGEAGKDTFDVTASVAAATVSGTANTATGYVTTIKDFAAGDTIDFVGGTNGAHSATANSVAELTLTTETQLSEAVANALNLSPGTGTQKDVAWFNWGGDTYVVFDAADDTTNDGGLVNGDIVVKLTGTLDLTGSEFDATNGSFILG